jgi:hypothetical protein
MHRDSRGISTLAIMLAIRIAPNKNVGKRAFRFLFNRVICLWNKLVFSNLGLSVFTVRGNYEVGSAGGCTIFAPPRVIKLFLEGVGFLKAADPDMFRRLTQEGRYVCVYRQEVAQTYGYFGITDRFLSWGKEGVAAALVNAVLKNELYHAPLGLRWNPKFTEVVEARRQFSEQLFLWLDKHSTQSELVVYYERLSEWRNRYSRERGL